MLHDLAIPGSRANIDHVAVGPGGVFVIDSKRWKGYVWVDDAGHARRGGYSIQPALDTLWWETAQVADALADLPFPCPIRPLICLHRGSTPRNGVYADGIAIIPATLLRALLRAQTPGLSLDQIGLVGQRLHQQLPAAS
ncbi:MAG: nuclease-related domain-containing protein [Egibacteraceae bacterium]